LSRFSIQIVGGGHFFFQIGGTKKINAA